MPTVICCSLWPLLEVISCGVITSGLTVKSSHWCFVVELHHGDAGVGIGHALEVCRRESWSNSILQNIGKDRIVPCELSKLGIMHID